MKAEEEFDDIFRKKAEEANFDFRQSDWEKVRRKIDEQRLAEYQNVSGVNYWLVSAIALIGSAVLIFLAIPENNAEALADEVVYQPEQQQTLTVKSLPSEPAALAVLSTGVAKSSPVSPRAFKSISSIPSSRLANSSNPKTQVFESTVVPDNSQVSITDNQQASQTKEDISKSTIESFIDPEEVIDMVTLQPRTARLSLTQFEGSQLSGNVINIPDDPEYVSKNSQSKQSFNAEFGLSLFGGWIENSVSSGNGLNLFGGLNYNRMLNDKWSLSMGSQVYNLKGLNTVFYQNSSNDFGFGSTQTQTVLTCHSMMFVSFPLRIYYHPDQKHSLSLGLHAGSLLMAKNTIEIMQLSDGQIQQYSSEKQNSVYENMNSANFLLSMGLNKNIQERVSLQVELFYGLSDLFADSDQSKLQQNTSGIRIGLNYRISGK